MIALSTSSLLFTSCEKDEKVPETQVSAGANNLFVANQGNFTKSNASVSLINLDNSTVSSDVFLSANAKPLGDVAQSMALINGNVYIVVNGSNRIEVVNADNFKLTDSIAGLAAPNYIVEAGNGKAYVSATYGAPISVVNTTTNSVVNSINCPGSTQEMLTFGGLTYVANSGSDYLFVINNTTDLISDSILVGKGAQSLALDASQNLWIAFGAIYDSQPPYSELQAGSVKKVQLSGKTVTTVGTMAFGGVGKIRADKAKTSLYYTYNNGLYKVGSSASTLPSSAIYSSAGYGWYGLGVDTKTDLVYVADAKDYTGNGSVYQVDNNGSLKNTFTVGIIPGEFLFYHK